MYVLVFIVSLAFAAAFDLNQRDLSMARPNKTKAVHPFLGMLLAFMVLVPLCFIGCLREGVGTDYNLYESEYYQIFSGGTAHFDIGYTILNKIIIRLGLGYQFVIAISFIFFIGGVYYFVFRHCCNYVFFATALLIFSYNYFVAYSLIAQYTAIGLLFVGLSFLFEKRYASAIVFSVFATLIHSSAIFFFGVIVLFLFLNHRCAIRLQTMIVLMVVFGILGLACRAFIPFIVSKTRFGGYLTDPNAQDLYGSLSSNSSIVINIAVLLFQLYLIEKDQRLLQSTQIELFIFLQFFAVFFSLLQGQIILMFRFIYYLSAFQIISLPIFISSVNSKKMQFNYCITIVLFFFIWWLLFPMRNDYYHVLPYVSIFSEIDIF